MGLRTGDWIGLDCGDRVVEVCTEEGGGIGRHLGRVEAIFDGGAQVKVKWLDTGHVSYLHRDQLRVVLRYAKRDADYTLDDN